MRRYYETRDITKQEQKTITKHHEKAIQDKIKVAKANSVFRDPKSLNKVEKVTRSNYLASNQKLIGHQMKAFEDLAFVEFGGKEALAKRAFEAPNLFKEFNEKVDQLKNQKQKPVAEDAFNKTKDMDKTPNKNLPKL